MKVAVMGSGGLGSYFGGLLANAGLDVTFIARGQNLDTLQSRGLTLRELDGSEFHTNVRAIEDPSSIGPVDLLWFTVKTYDIDSAASQVKSLIGNTTLVLPLQNGVEAAELIQDVVGEGHVLGGVCLGGATLVSPGVVEAKVPRVRVQFGEMAGGTSPRTESLLDALTQAGVAAELSADIKVDIWQKFIVACMTLGLSSLTRLPLGPMFDYEETRTLALGVIEEAAAVARAEGVRLPENAGEKAFAFLQNVAKESPEARGSMYFDLVQGRRLELDGMNGAVVRLGRKHGIPTPCNFVVLAALQPYAMGSPAKAVSPQ
jgi:2-dehydropantoate 2-reductase